MVVQQHVFRLLKEPTRLFDSMYTDISIGRVSFVLESSRLDNIHVGRLSGNTEYRFTVLVSYRRYSATSNYPAKTSRKFLDAILNTKWLMLYGSCSLILAPI